MLNNANERIARYKEIKANMAKLKSEADSIEAEFLTSMLEDLEDTKFKTVEYADDNGNTVTATMADSVKVIYPSFLKKIFGEAYKDVITEETTYKISTSGQRLLSALYQENFIRNSSMSELIDGMLLDDKTKKAVSKKIKGKVFATDVKNLIKIAKYDDLTAQTNAYLASEVRIWEDFSKLLQLNYEVVDDSVVDQALKWIDGAIVVEQNPKISIKIK